MEKSTKKWLLTCLAALAAGVLLHFLFRWLPNPVTALISPVRESIWEHVKLLYYPMLAAALFLNRGCAPGKGHAGLTPWLASMLIVYGAMLGAGWLYHVALRGENLAFDLLLYALLMIAGFALPRILWPLGQWRWAEKLASGLTLLLGLLIIWFTFFPPEGALFASMGGTLRTFLTIPV